MKFVGIKGSALGLILTAVWPLSGFQVLAPPAPPRPPRVTRIASLTSSGSFLGVGVAEVDAERARALKLQEVHGVEVTRVEEDTPASKAGLKTGDVILEYNGQRVEGAEQFGRLVRETPSGREVKMAIARNGVNQTISAKIAARKMAKLGGNFDEAFRVVIPKVHIPDFEMPDIPRAFTLWSSSALGIEAESVDSQLAQYFGVKEGVLIRSVTKGSAAEKAGLRAGDVLLKVGDTPVRTPRDVSAAVRSLRSKTSFGVTLMRERKEINLTVTPSDDRSEGEAGAVLETC